MFTGCGTALITPFRTDGSLDERALRVLIHRQIDAGINFLVPCGTTGEVPTLSLDEHLRIAEISVEEARGRVPILAGAGGYNTEHVSSTIRRLERLGVSGILSVTPYYNKPTQHGLIEHYRALADSTSLPIVVYSVQSRTGVNVEPATLVKLAEIRNIVGVKEASGNISQIASILSRVPESFLVLSGDDAIALPVIALGGHGVISVVANEIPGEFTQLTQAALAGRFEEARKLQRRYQALIEMNFIESNPGPVKFALSRLGLVEPVWRLPLVAPQSDSQRRIEQTLEEAGLLKGVQA